MKTKNLVSVFALMFGFAAVSINVVSPVPFPWEKDDKKKEERGDAKERKEEEISNFSNLPKLGKLEALGEVFRPQIQGEYLKRLLKAIMYIDVRLRILEQEAGINAPILKKVKSVREALRGITKNGESVKVFPAAMNQLGGMEGMGEK